MRGRGARHEGGRFRFARTVRAIGFGLAISAMGGCGDGPSGPAGGKNGSPPGLGETASIDCPRNASCTVSLAHGARLRIPTGAVSVDELEIGIETVANLDGDGRSHRYRLTPDGARFDKPLLLELPVVAPADGNLESYWCKHSKLGDETRFDVFHPVASSPLGAGAFSITCELRHFSSVAASVGGTFATYRGIPVSPGSLNACDGRGFSSKQECKSALSDAADCSYCPGPNDCWIPGAGGHCCPSESGALDDGCWLSFRDAPVGASPDACGGDGFSTYDACVNGGVPGIECSYCGGHNDCWIPGGGGSCCPGEGDGTADDDGCWASTSLSESKSACGGEGFWTEAACQQGIWAANAASTQYDICYCSCGGNCVYCGGHNQCWYIIRPDDDRHLVCPGESPGTSDPSPGVPCEEPA